MTWGDFQSVFQLIAGLNIAFYAIKEIRLPYATRAVELVEDAIAFVRLAPKSKAGIDILNTERNVTALTNSSNLELFERIAEFTALSASVVGVCSLIYSSFNYNAPLPAWFAATITGVGFTPFFGMVFMNYFVALRLRRAIRELPSLKSKLAEAAAAEAESVTLR